MVVEGCVERVATGVVASTGPVFHNSETSWPGPKGARELSAADDDNSRIKLFLSRMREEEEEVNRQQPLEDSL